MKPILAIALFVMVSCPCGPVAAGDRHGGVMPGAARFFGLWEGIDVSDGSGMQRSIAQGPGGTLRVLGRETLLSYCNGAAGIIAGTGIIDQGRLYVEDQRLKCSGGSEVPIPAVYDLNRGDGTLVETPNDTTVEPLVYHRISRRR